MQMLAGCLQVLLEWPEGVYEAQLPQVREGVRKAACDASPGAQSSQAQWHVGPHSVQHLGALAAHMQPWTHVYS